MNITNLKQHAYHKIEIGDQRSKISIEVKVEGAESYVQGLAGIVKSVSKLAKGNYQVEDLIKLDCI